jgi:hypothetical protein
MLLSGRSRRPVRSVQLSYSVMSCRKLFPRVPFALLRHAPKIE